MFALRWPVAILLISMLAFQSPVLRLDAAEAGANPMTYGEARDFLTKYTKVIELTDSGGGRVAICPDYQGRVMTSTCGGLEGKSFGWIGKSFIAKGKPDAHFNNYGGEDRFWLGPEGGQFSLWFAPGAKQNLANWLTPAALNDGAFKVATGDTDPAYHLTRRMQFRNASKTQFDLEVKRDVRLLDAEKFGSLFGADARKALESGGLKSIGFQTANTITNRGAPMTKAKGLVAIWSLGQFPPGPETQILVPYKALPKTATSPVVKSDYFGPVPKDRLVVGKDAVRFRGDGNYRSKIGISRERAKPVAGSIDRTAGVLTLVHFTMPDDPTKYPYVNNAWNLPQKQPFVGDVFNSYNDGPPEPGKPALGGFYELESLSPAAELASGKSLTHVQSIFHVEGSVADLEAVAKAALGIEKF